MALKNPKFQVVAGLFFLFLLYTRFYELGAKPYHHDESLYAVESWKYLVKGLYEFNPMLHGPFLFHLQAALFWILPINNVTGRLPVAIAGVLFPLLGLVVLRRRGAAVAATWIGFCALSPVFSFFSRFLGMDLIMIALGTGLMAALYELRSTRNVNYLYAVFVASAFMVCTKLNFLFYFFSIFSFAAIELLWLRNQDKNSTARIWGDVRTFVAKHKWDVLTCVGLFIAIFCLLYSALGRHPAGILDGLYRKMFPYWAEQHRIQRIKGPFPYYLPFLMIYELPVLIAIVWAFFRAAFSSRQMLDVAWRGCMLILASWAFCHFNWGSVGGKLTTLCHLDEPYHVAIAAFEVLVWWVLMKFHMHRNERLEAFSVHWGMFSLLIYSYAGEKIPWLTTHILLPWCFYVALVFPGLVDRQIGRRIPRLVLGLLLILTVSWQGMITYRSSIALSADPRERLVYTHTSWDIVHIFEKIERLGKALGMGQALVPQIVGDSAWPFYWYLRDYKRWFYLALEPNENPPVVIVDWEKRDLIPDTISSRYTMERYKLREWWLAETKTAGWLDYIRYYIYREPFSELGHQDIALFVRNDLLPLWK